MYVCVCVYVNMIKISGKVDKPTLTKDSIFCSLLESELHPI